MKKKRKKKKGKNLKPKGGKLKPITVSQVQTPETSPQQALQINTTDQVVDFSEVKNFEDPFGLDEENEDELKELFLDSSIQS